MKIDSKIFEKAILFALNAHNGQVRKGDGRPYILHPISVMNRIYEIKSSSSNLFLLGIASLLHDTVEDTDVTLEQIAQEFGYQVASIVQELTIDEKECKRVGKAEYLASTMIAMSSYALCIKLCDRLDNICDMKQLSEEERKKRTDETVYILVKLKAERIKLTKTHTKLTKLIFKNLV